MLFNRFSFIILSKLIGIKEKGSTFAAGFQMGIMWRDLFACNHVKKC